jgi:aminopeptidase YwaD
MNRSKRTSSSPAPSKDRIQQHWSYLCTTIGERRAGSAGDSAAADYIVEQFRAAGLTAVHAESFPCVSVVHARAEVAIGNGGALKSVPGRVLAGSPATAGSGAVESELVWIEMPEQAERLLQPALRGKIVVLFGPMPTRVEWHQRLVKAQPAAVIHVDDRLPFEWVKDDGVYPAWARRFGMPPTLTIPFRAAWDLRKSGANRGRVLASVELKTTTSQNVVGEIPGRRPNLPFILLGAHHDTQCNNTGADDNASGVVALLELAALLSQEKPFRTIRLVSFGAEEQLSVGSACYVAAHKREMGSFGVVLNLDSVSSPLGHHWLLRAGSKAFGAWLVKRLGQAGLDVAERSGTMPFADHFPFSAFGVPSVTFMRPNMDGGMRWQHHSAQDALENVSADELVRVVRAVGQVTRKLALAPRWPFSRGLAPEQRAETARMAEELFGLRA